MKGLVGFIAVLLAVLLLPSCRTSGSGSLAPSQSVAETGAGTVQPGAPGEATGPVRVPPADQASGRRHSSADAAFMRGMIAHHAQALEMTDLVAERTQGRDMRLLARRIEDSQRSEISLMQRWLRERGEEVPEPGMGHRHQMVHAHSDLMPGMLTPAQMDTLKQSAGVEFEAFFLKFMISHHQGALVMVEDLLVVDGAAQDSETFRFVADVDADQRMEIRRMREMLARLPITNKRDDE